MKGASVTNNVEPDNPDQELEVQDEVKIIPSMKETILVLFLTVAFIFLITILFFVLGRVFDLDPNYMLLSEAFIILPAVVFGKIKGYSLRTIFRINSVTGRQMLLTLMIGFSLIFIINAFENWLQGFLQSLHQFDWLTALRSEFEIGLLDSLQINSIYRFFSTVFAVVIFAAVCEEMLFRGLLQQTFENRLSRGWAIFLTAFLFTILHPFSLLPILILSIFLGIMSWRSNSILPTMVIHGMNNGMSLIAVNISENIQTNPSEAIPVSPVLFVLSLLIFTASFIHYFKITRVEQDDSDI